MYYRLGKNVVVTFEKDRIVFLKGVWKLMPFEISKNDYKQEWKKIDTLFHKLVRLNEAILIDEINEEKSIVLLFQKLTSLNIVYIKNANTPIQNLVCSKQTYEFIQDNENNFTQLNDLNFIDIETFVQQKIDDLNDFLIICNNCSFLEIRRINEKIVSLNKKYFLLILKADFLHIFFHNANNSPCFECYYELILSQMENENYLEFLKIKDLNAATPTADVSELNYAIAYFYLLLINKNYFDDVKTNHKLISFYFPTLETNVINLRKKSDCPVCHG